MAETVNGLTFVWQTGYPLYIFEVLEAEEEEEVIAVASDDRLVRVLDAMRVRVGSGHGCGGTTSGSTWYIETIRQLPKGSYEFLAAVPAAVAREKQYRIDNKKAWKRWHKRCHGIGHWLVSEDEDDDFYMNEALEAGLEAYVRDFG